jgi:hypothetical protein
MENDELVSIQIFITKEDDKKLRQYMLDVEDLGVAEKTKSQHASRLFRIGLQNEMEIISQ